MEGVCFVEKDFSSVGCFLLLPSAFSPLQIISLGRARVMVYRSSALTFVIFLFPVEQGVCFGCCTKPSIWFKLVCERASVWIQKLSEVRFLDRFCICCRFVFLLLEIDDLFVWKWLSISRDLLVIYRYLSDSSANAFPCLGCLEAAHFEFSWCVTSHLTCTLLLLFNFSPASFSKAVNKRREVYNTCTEHIFMWALGLLGDYLWKYLG